QHALLEAARQAAKSENRPGEMRPIALLRSAFIVLLLLGSSGLAQLAGDAPAVAAFAERVGLRDVTGFVETVQSLRSTGHLPRRYATKDEARAHGWRGVGRCAGGLSRARRRIGGARLFRPQPRRVVGCDRRLPRRAGRDRVAPFGAIGGAARSRVRADRRGVAAGRARRARQTAARLSRATTPSPTFGAERAGVRCGNTKRSPAGPP